MLGIALIKECVRNNSEVVAVSRTGSARNIYIPALKGVTIVECSLNEIAKLPSLVSGDFDVFFHLGWGHTDKEGRINPVLQEANIKYTLDAVKTASVLGCNTFIGAGSQAEYGRVSGIINENTAIVPEMAYGISKYAAGRLSSLACSDLGLRHIWTRIFSVYGPYNRDDNMIVYCMDKLIKGEKPSLTKCEQQWDYLYSADAARALYLSYEKGKDKAVYNIGGGRTRQLSEYIQIMRNAINPSLELGFGDIPYPEGQVMHLCADISLINRDTGYRPLTDFKQGIEETIKWYREKES
jgi:nucleoside-diphosphate-sugar epimerase